MKKRLTKIQKEELIKLYQSGKYTCRDLGKAFNMSGVAVQGLLKRRGIARTAQTYLQRKYKINENYFDEIDSEEKAYFLGFLYADGYNNTDRHTVTLSLQEKDVEILIRLKELLGYEKPLSKIKLNMYNKNRSDQYRLTIHNKRISEKLDSFGCIKNKTYTLSYPSFLSENLHRHFIRGYCDGDGWIGKRSVSITSSKTFCQDLKVLITKTLSINTYNRRPHPHTNENIESLEISGELKCRKFLFWLYNDCTISLKRKYERYIDLITCEIDPFINRSWKKSFKNNLPN